MDECCGCGEPVYPSDGSFCDKCEDEALSDPEFIQFWVFNALGVQLSREQAIAFIGEEGA